MEPEQPGYLEAREPEIPEESSTGIPPRMAAVLSYFAGFLSGVLFLFVERENAYVRFHAMQSTITFGALFVASVVFRFIPVLGRPLAFLTAVIGLILWLHLMYRALQGEWYKLPWAGDLAEEQLGL